MTDGPLKGFRILVVEDEYLLADDLFRMLVEAGAEVFGPVASVNEAMSLISSDLDGAVLDINLRGELVFPVAQALQEQDIPFAFSTGYDAEALPQRFFGSPRLDKPLRMSSLIRILYPLLRREAPPNIKA